MVPVSARLATKPARLFSVPRALLLAALLFAAWPSMAEAQYFPENSIPDTFDDQTTSGVVLLGRPGGLLGPFADTGYFGPYLSLQHTAGDGPGYRDNGYTTLSLFVPRKAFSGILFSEGRLSVDDFGELIGNVGGGYRYYSAEQNRTYGGSLWYDVDAGHRSTFSQGGVSLETRGQGWDFFINGYFPIDDDPKQFRRIATPTGINTFGFVGVNLAVNQPNLVTRQSEVAMTGFDAELGGPLPIVGKYGIRGYGGYYHYENDNVTDINGGRMRLQADFTDSLVGQFMLTNDNQFDTSAIFTIAWTLPGSGAARGEWNRPGVNRTGRTVVRAQSPGGRDSIRQYYRMFQPTQRNNRLFVSQTNTTTLEDNIRVITDPDTGQPIVIYHMDSRAAAGGDGTFETPFANPQEAQGGTGPGDLIFTHAGSVFDNPANNFIALQQNQQLLGEGPAYIINTDELGPIPIPASGDVGGFPVIQGAGGPAAITLANGSRVSAFDINDSTTAGILANAGLTAGNSALVENTTINRGPIGLDVLNAAGTVNFAASSSINDTTTAALNVAGMMTTGTINVHGPINNSMGRAIEVNDLPAGGVVNVTGMVTDTGGTGINIATSAGNVTVANANLTIPAGDGVTLTDNLDGTIRFGQIDVTTAAGNAFVANDTGVAANSGNLFVGNGNLDATGGQALFLDGSMAPLTINARFTDVTSTGSAMLNNAGITVNGVSGTLAITGTATVDTPTGNGVEFIDSDATFTIAAVDIDNTAGAGIFLQDTSGGAPDRLTGSLIVNGGSIDGSTGPSFDVMAGSATTIYQGNINHTVAGSEIVRIQDTSAAANNMFEVGTLVDMIGDGILLSNADGDASFMGTTTIAGPATRGVLINNGSSGDFVWGANATITDTTGVAFEVNGSASNSAFFGTITQSNAVRVVEIDDLQAGGQAIFSGPVIAQQMSTGTRIQNSEGNATFANLDMDNVGGGGNGDLTQLRLDNNTGTYTFDTLNIITDGTQGILATNGGRLNIGSDGTSTVATNAQTAVSISNTAAGAINFQTITATNTAGNPGVLLSNISGAGTFVVDDNSAGTANDLRVMNTGGGNGLEINGAATDSTFTFAGVDIDSTGAGMGIDLDGIGGTVNFARTDIDDTGIGVNLNEVAGTVNFSDGNDLTSDDLTISMTNNNAGIDINDTGDMANITFAGTQIDNTGGGAGVDINGGGGNITFGDGSGMSTRDLDITNTGGGAGINIAATNDMANISFETVEIDDTAGGDGVNISGAADGTIAFGDGDPLTDDDLIIFDTDGGDGIEINGTAATGTFTFSSVDIDDTATGAGVNILNAAGTITFDDGSATDNTDLSISNTGGAHGFLATTSAATINVAGLQVSNTGAAFDGVNLNGLTGVFTAGTTNIVTGGGAFRDGIRITGGTGTYNFATAAGQSTNVNGSTGHGINIDATEGPVNFGVSNIVNATLNGANFTDTTGPITFGQTNVNGAVNGIDIDNATGTMNFSAGGTIQGFSGNGIEATTAGASHVFSGFTITSNGNNNVFGILFDNTGGAAVNPLTISSNAITFTGGSNATGIDVTSAANNVTIGGSNGAANNNTVLFFGVGGATDDFNATGTFPGSSIRVNGVENNP